MKTKIKYLSSIGIVIVFLVSSALLADDDDDDESEKHERQGRGIERSFGVRELEALPVHTAFKKECTSCHMAYHPGLLPERSWKKMMSKLSDHFGEDASLDQKTKMDIEKFLVDHSADKSSSRRSVKMASAIPATETPLRITETLYFERKHDEISANVYKRPKVGSASNCIACHKGAESGYFSEHEVRIPKL